MSDKQLTENDVRKIVKQEIKGDKKEKRPLSEYQKHMSICMKKEGATFGSCVEQWKKKKN